MSSLRIHVKQNVFIDTSVIIDLPVKRESKYSGLSVG